MLFVVVLMFVVSWLPLQTFSMVVFVYPNLRENYQYQSSEYNLFVGAYFTCHWLSMAHSCFNPLIYCFMSDNFRNDLGELLCKPRTQATGTYLEANRGHLSAGALPGVRVAVAIQGAHPTVLMAPPRALVGHVDGDAGRNTEGPWRSRLRESITSGTERRGDEKEKRSLDKILRTSLDPLKPKACRVNLRCEAGFLNGPASV